MTKFNLNTWLMLSPLAKSLIVSSTKNGKYAVKKSDLKNGFYFEYIEANIKITVPMGAVFETNNKLNGILGIKFCSATECPSQRLGTCQVPKGATCYGVQGERQSKHKFNFNGVAGMSGSQNGELCSYFWDLFAQSGSIRVKFLSYCSHYGIKTLRFNNKGDFRGVQDIAVLYYLSQMGDFDKIYGYTARDDLYLELQSLIMECDNIRLNGSNLHYNNRFFVTPYISDILKADYYCVGDCSKCGNCRNLNGKTIYCLVHGSGSDTVLNNAVNRELVYNFFANCQKWDMTPEHRGNLNFKECKGLSKCVNKMLERERVILRIGSPKELVNYMRKFKKDLEERGYI